MAAHRLSPSFLSRRGCLQWLGLEAAALAALGSPLARAGVPPAMPAAAPMLSRKRLLLFALYGGNDGLNTLVPYRDPLYRRLRPTLGLRQKTLLTLNDDLALHPALREFMAMMQAGEVAVIQDVGYPEPNLSHFECAAVWESGQPRRETRSAGWFGEVVMRNRAAFDRAGFDADAVSFDKSTGFAAGTGVPVYVARQNLAETLGAPQTMPPAHVGADAQDVQARLARIVNEGHEVRARLAARLKEATAPEWAPYEDALSVQTKLTDWFVHHGVATPVIRLAQDGYDTHANMLSRQEYVLTHFDAALGRLKRSLQAAGAWDDTVVMVHSEFGRRAAENGHSGTDHGTAGPVFLIGGKVRGGVYGQRARLDDLDGEGNLKFTTDFRRVYATVVDRLWGLPVNPFAQAGHAPLDIALA